MTKEQAKKKGFLLRWDHTGKTVPRGCCYFYHVPNKEPWPGAVFPTEEEAMEYLDTLLDREAARTWQETFA